MTADFLGLAERPVADAEQCALQALNRQPCPRIIALPNSSGGDIRWLIHGPLKYAWNALWGSAGHR